MGIWGRGERGGGSVESFVALRRFRDQSADERGDVI
jgi:hypothetical protein